MSTNLITGYAGKAHITSGGDGAVNAALFGKGRYVLDIGERFSYEIISNNLIRIKSGYAINQGRKIELSVNDYEELIIDNGLQGVKRCDLIAVTYEKNLETGIETAVMNVIKGTSGDDYLDPEHTVGNILKGDAKDDFLLYRVKINGLSIESVEKLFEVRKSLIESDTAENTTTFTSSDVADGSASAWTNVSKLSSGEKHSSIFAKMSQMFKNVRYLYKMLGTTDISKIGNGTCTGAISSLNDGLKNISVESDSELKIGDNLYSKSFTTENYLVPGKWITLATLDVSICKTARIDFGGSYMVVSETFMCSSDSANGTGGMIRYNYDTGEIQAYSASNTELRPVVKMIYNK